MMGSEIFSYTLFTLRVRRIKMGLPIKPSSTIIRNLFTPLNPIEGHHFLIKLALKDFFYDYRKVVHSVPKFQIIHNFSNIFIHFICKVHLYRKISDFQAIFVSIATHCLLIAYIVITVSNSIENSRTSAPSHQKQEKI